MKNYNSPVIEKIAATTVISLAASLNTCLDPNINMGDKGISYDGTIDIYSVPNLIKKNLIGSVPVQVKGKTIDREQLNRCSYPVDMDDLDIYYAQSGVLFFVVLITPSNQKRIFYRMLLPLELKEVVKRKSRKATKTFKFNYIDTLDHLTRICRIFLEESKKQSLSLIEHEYKLEEFQDFKLTFLDLVEEDIDKINDFKNILGSSAFVYGEEKGRVYPINSITISSVLEEGVIQRNIGNESISFTYSLTRNSSETIIKIEDLILISCKDNRKRSNLQIEELTNLYDIKRSRQFLSSLNDEQQPFYIGEKLFEKPSKKIQENVENQLKTVFQLEKLFSILGIPLKYEFKNEAFVDKFLELLFIFNNERYELLQIPKEIKGNGLISLKVFDNYEVYLYFNSTQKEKLTNIFSAEISNKISMGLKDKLNETKISLFLSIPIQELLNYINYNQTIVISSLSTSKMDYNHFTFGYINNYALDCLKLFDETGDARLLEIASTLLSNCLLVEDERSIAFINLCQTKMRQGKRLSEQELNEIIKIKRAAVMASNTLLELCANLMLNNKSEAKANFKSLDPEQKEQFSAFPIRKFL
ncbi:hypothetical protein [Bacillus sp. Hm123]|uniref:hypothetical protein n=1 Tax=Bacillus sp. Hm123 TaxID=3450745 RepID=UPI003F42C648